MRRLQGKRRQGGQPQVAQHHVVGAQRQGPRRLQEVHRCCWHRCHAYLLGDLYVVRLLLAKTNRAASSPSLTPLSLASGAGSSS